MPVSNQLFEPDLSSQNNQKLTRRRISPIVWLNLVCLDAPIVALTWQWLFARDFHVALPVAERVALFLTAWLIYLVDRLADVWNLSPLVSQSLRQEFCRKHWRGWIALCISVGLADLWVIFRNLDAEIIRAGIFVGVIALVYLTINYWLGKLWRFLPVKEMCVGSLFALGTVTTLFPRHALSLQLISALVLFATLCSLNCISIAVWERDLDVAQRKNSIATRWAGARLSLRPSAFVIGILAAVCVGGSRAIGACLIVSTFLLGALDWSGTVIARDERTAIADLVLLTPLLVAVFQFVLS